MAEPYKHIYKVDLNQQLVRHDVGLLATFDSKANQFGAELYRDGASVSASGYEVMGYFIRPDEETVNCPGTVEGNLVYVDLLPGCYLYDGAFDFTLKVKKGDEEKAVLMCYGTVVRSRTDATASGGEVVVTVTNAQNLDGKPPEYYLPVQNLLRNPDLAIAQAGYNTNHGNVRYCADGWTSDSVSVAYKKTHFEVTAGSAYKWLKQKFLVSDLTADSYTLAVKLKGGSGQLRIQGSVGATVTGLATKNIVGGDSDWITGVLSIDKSKLAEYEYAYFCIYSTDAGTVLYKDLALYPGTYTDETVPPCVPPDHTLELAKCQRVFMPVPTDAILTGFSGSSGAISLFVPCPYMSPTATPTVINGDGVDIVVVGNNIFQTCTDWTVNKYADGGVRITTPTTLSMFKTAVSGYVNTTNTRMFISCEP